MPFSQDTGKRESDRYCSKCFSGGKLTYAGTDVKLFQEKSYQAMRESGMNPVKAKFFAFLIQFAPRWKNVKAK